MTQKERIQNELKAIHDAMLHAEERHSASIKNAATTQTQNAVNLLDYLVLRSRNIEQLQFSLHNLGLSSLTGSENNIRSHLVKVMSWLEAEQDKIPKKRGSNATDGLEQNVKELLGDPQKEVIMPVMVTFDSGFAGDVPLVSKLLLRGMSIARINCAHDDEKIWSAMIATLKQACGKTGLSCKIYMELAGPKIRTQVITRKHDEGKMKVGLDDEIILTDLERTKKSPKKFLRCTLPGIVSKLRQGDRILLDDGLFEARVTHKERKLAKIRITRISAAKPFIKSGKGMNFPDTNFSTDAITTQDKNNLAFITQNADMVGFSFLKRGTDLTELHQLLKRLQKPEFPVIAKIETREAVENLPEIILQGMHQRLTGVMVARGDLAMEIGFERMSEIQDEILWICQAAHVPVIWATQVLENLQKHGIASRGEITDAAHAARADCVMLNKGEHTAEALTSLTDILWRSRRNEYKSHQLFRQLSIASRFLNRRKMPLFRRP